MSRLKLALFLMVFLSGSVVLTEAMGQHRHSCRRGPIISLFRPGLFTHPRYITPSVRVYQDAPSFGSAPSTYPSTYPSTSPLIAPGGSGTRVVPGGFPEVGSWKARVVANEKQKDAFRDEASSSFSIPSLEESYLEFKDQS